jgi:hypothetical protein
MEQQDCPHCGDKLIAVRCKIQCPRCGYTEDCADAGLIDYDAQERKIKRSPQPPPNDTSQKAHKRYSTSL